MKYILIDTSNLFFRARHSVTKGADIDTQMGYCLHLMFTITGKVQRLFKGDHMVFCLEGNSWRKEFYPPYKRNRVLSRSKSTVAEKEEEELFLEVYAEFIEYITEKTNCTVLINKDAEGDDMIARWINFHPKDEHVIISNDSDFIQLISKNVTQYNGVQEQLISLDGYHDDKGKPVINKKTSLLMEAPEPRWLLFEKCIRGDKSDNVFSAYPGVRKKGTKKSIGLLEAFDDIDKQGYAWNNLMLQRWIDHEEKEHIVRDDYNRNKKLIDLDAQPQDIKDSIDMSIIEIVRNPHKPKMIGTRFLQFCGKHELKRLSSSADWVIPWLSSEYKGELLYD